ncbi:hypothetical protein LOTGIDRAFT_160121 [Lottia gigantea]|uniref:Protein quiver n=1 Tax=Lottia gigantea TaxID=225164 RepID=V4C3L6_LOTGI|nr:hypothetical protein LOTGIDRAFT_160121 [Lottia gigantea]ESO96134.1 hypothetical protein LOTGIDRAFT_160121 [Lottia gigantea]
MNSVIVLFSLLIFRVYFSEALRCYDCQSHNTDDEPSGFCPRNGTVDATKAYVNDKCDGKCFTKGNDIYNDHAGRGCTTGFSLPSPLPDDGCYIYGLDTWCICSNDTCNGQPMGEGSEELDAHLRKAILSQGAKDGIMKCFNCINYDAKGQHYSQCPKYGTVSLSAWKMNCTGHCYTRSDDLDPRKVYRGCTDTLPSLASMPPVDGCYTYYLETWCVCKTYLCNGGPIGVGTVELDAHIVENAMSVITVNSLFLKCLGVIVFVLRWAF